MGLNFDQINARLRKNLQQLSRYQDPAERLRLLKRYLSHFVKFVQAGRHFEATFGEHVRLVVLFLNDRRDKPLELDTLGTIVKTLCIICTITAISHQTVMIALHGLLDIFERISSKETLTVIEFCGNHFNKLIVQFKRFGYFKIQRQLVELVYITSLSVNKSNDRKNFVLKLGRSIGGSWEEVLSWKSIAVQKEVRLFINNLQDRYPLFSAYSVPVEDCQIGEYRFEQPNDSNGMWLDVNFKPATIRFAGCIKLVRGNDKSLDLIVGLEIDHRSVSKIDWKTENGKHFLLIEYKKITVEPDVLKVEPTGTFIVSVVSSFDCDYLINEVIPEVRMKAISKDDSEPLNTTNIDGLLNISLLESNASEPAKSHYSDQSPRLRDNRDAIEQHRNMRCQMLDTTSSVGSNKENIKPRVPTSDVRVVVQDVQRLRVFETLQQDCRQETNKRETKRSPLKKHKSDENRRDSQSNDGKKRKLFDKQSMSDILNESADSQIQRNKYVEKKLVNTVKPIQTLDVKPINLIPSQEKHLQNTDVLNESSGTDVMSSHEFEQSLEAYKKKYGIFGKAQKVLDKKLESNIRKINEMVERSTKRFFKRDQTADNPYDFIDSESNQKSTKKKTSRKANNNVSKRKPKKNDENFSSKVSKNVTNQSIRNMNSKSVKKDKNLTPPKPTIPHEPRLSLPRSKKPTKFIDFASESENETGNTFQNLNISHIAVDEQLNPMVPTRRPMFAKSTPHAVAKNKKRPLNQTFGVDVLQKTDDQISAKKQRVPLMEVEAEHEKSSTFIRRDYKKHHLPEALVKKVGAFIERDADKALSPQQSFTASSNQSDVTKISLEVPKPQSPSVKNISLTKEMILQYQPSMSDSSIPESLEVNPSPSNPVPDQNKAELLAEPTVSNFDMNYAKHRYTLKKFISNNGQTFVAEQESRAYFDTKPQNNGNESILTDDIRVGCDTAVPPSLQDDWNENGGVIMIDITTSSRRYPITTKPEPSKMIPNTPKPGKNQNARCSETYLTRNEVAANGTIAQETFLPSSILFNDTASGPTMVQQFSTKIHQEFNPSLSELQTQVEKLNDMMKSFEPDLSNFNNKEIDQKCKEVLELENKLDVLHIELAKLCEVSLERYRQATVTGNKLARFAESKGNYFKERVQQARQEIPGIVDECVKSVWNQHIRGRLDQVQSMLTKMLM
ncbi:uncharacterized protein LOC134217482 [Armigeres subalbatus]|uniref:uncharacterized protein LOC134217482 n=1 Tax=Armigeres subalbatus TaxID=124917 RepID=UPI002ED58AAA